MSQIPTIAVIMSSYNGEEYIGEQIDSILAQKNVHVELFIRDDGSTDSTREIISDYVKRYENIHADFGDNIGCGPSFLQETKRADGYDYYAFSDQDDVWLEGKLFNAVKAIKHEECIKGRNFPVLWYSNLNVADRELNITRKTEFEKKIHSLERILIRQAIPGCSMVMNAEVRNLITSERTDRIMMKLRCLHDALEMPLMCGVGGVFICEPEAYMYHRLHGNNSSGGSDKLIPRIIREWRQFKRGKGWTAIFAKTLLKEWGDKFTPEARKVFTKFAYYKENWLYRLEIVFLPKYRTGDFRYTLVGKIRILFGKL